MNHLLQLFFEQTLRHWHFEALLKASGLSRERLNFYLKQLLRKNVVRRIKPRGRMPYYLAFEYLHFDWELLEQIRMVRNNNKYQNLDISKEMWKSIELPFETYITTLRKEVERRLEEA